MKKLPGKLDKAKSLKKKLHKENSKRPLVTIVTPSYNQGDFIEKTIQSVLSQKYPNLEYIVIDGGSTDNTLEILRKYEHQLRWISEPDHGQSHAINKGLRMARGEIVAWLNSDDLFLPGAIIKAVRYLTSHPEVMMIYGEGYIIDEQGKIKRRFPYTGKKFDLWKLIYYSDYILQQTTFFRRSIFDTIQMLDESMHFAMDWDLFIRIGKRFPVRYIPEYLGCIREHGAAKSIRGGKRRFFELVRLMRRHGYMRYSHAYLNYLQNIINPKWLDCNSDRLFPSLIAQILHGIMAWYINRIKQELYPDGWIGRRGFIVLPNYLPEERKSEIVVKGEILKKNVPSKVVIDINRKLQIEKHFEKEGKFLWTIPLKPKFGLSDSFHVSFRTEPIIVQERTKHKVVRRTIGFRLISIKRL